WCFAKTKRTTNFPFGGWMCHVVKKLAEVFPRPQTTLLAARVAVRVFGCCCGEGPG
ncbi:hypothetical protein NDU88_000021, partial [Pleurodeles waltl]